MNTDENGKEVVKEKPQIYFKSIGLSCSVRNKAEQIIEKWDITEILKGIIHTK